MIEAPSLFLLCLFTSSISFVFYGVSCLASARIELEFRRYGLEHYRKLVGSLQLAGSVGLIAGLWLPLLGMAAAVGLAILMAFGLAVRRGLHDSIYQMLPAFLYLVLNGYLAYQFFKVYLLTSKT